MTKNVNPIYQQARDRTAQLITATRAVQQGSDDTALDAFALDIQVWRNTYKATRVEILLSCGGPSDGIQVDEYDRVTYWTSNTPDHSTQNVTLPDHESDYWLQYSEPYRWSFEDYDQ